MNDFAFRNSLKTNIESGSEFPRASALEGYAPLLSKLEYLGFRSLFLQKIPRLKHIAEKEGQSFQSVWIFTVLSKARIRDLSNAMLAVKHKDVSCQLYSLPCHCFGCNLLKRMKFDNLCFNYRFLESSIINITC